MLCPLRYAHRFVVCSSFCSDIISSFKFLRCIYLYYLGLFHWQQIASVLVTQTWRIWVKSTGALFQYEVVFPSMEILIIKTQRSWERPFLCNGNSNTGKTATLYQNDPRLKIKHNTPTREWCVKVPIYTTFYITYTPLCSEITGTSSSLIKTNLGISFLVIIVLDRT